MSALVCPPDDVRGPDAPTPPVRRLISHAPRPIPHLVTRYRLLDRLDARSPLTLVRAPVGFGKTALVAQWVSRQDGTGELVAWVRVRPGGGDATTIWTDVLHVLADAGLTCPQPAPRTPHLLAAQAERVITASDAPVVMVVDGFENLEDGVDRSLLDLLRYAMPLQLILCGRSHRRFPAHLHADLETTTISAPDLLFTAEETAQLLAAVGLDLPAPSVRAIHSACGGWPEPTREFAISVRHARPTQDELLAAVDTVAIDYLRRHVLPETTAPGKIELALATSLPEDFTVSLAALLTGDDQAKARLESLIRDGVLIGAERDGEPVYRWPGAARRALAKEFAGRDPERVAELHSRLAQWYLDEAMPERALHHAVQAKDWPLALRVIDSSTRALEFTYRHAELYDALIEMPIEIVASSPLALAVRDVRLRVPDELLFSAATLPATPDELARVGAAEGVAHVLETGSAVMKALRHRGELERACGYAAGLLQIAEAARSARPGEIRSIYPAVQLHAGVTRMARGDLPGALHCLWRAYLRAAGNPQVFVERDAAGKNALVHALAGDLPRAILWLRRHDAAPLQQTWLEPMIRASATAARALVALDRLDLDEAAAKVARDELSGPWDNAEMLWAYYVYAHARYALHAGTAADMLDQLDRARAPFGEWIRHGAVAGPLLAAAEADLLLGLGQANQARAVLTGPHADHPLLRVGRARLALITGDDVAALRLASDSSWARHALARHRLEMLLVQAVAAHRGGDVTAAADALRRAAHSARTGGSLQAFTTVPRDVLYELAAHVPAATVLLDDPALRAAPETFPAKLTLISLTRREQLVLEKLDEGLTTRQIADTLVVSVNTIKTQLRSLYGKLDTASRGQALALARHWGLLPAASRQPQPSSCRRASPIPKW